MGGAIMNNQEKVLMALDGFFAGKNLNGVTRFNSIGEAYVAITGDVNFTGKLSESKNLHEFVGHPPTETLWGEILGDAIFRQVLAIYKQPNALHDWLKIVSSIAKVQDFRMNSRQVNNNKTSLIVEKKGALDRIPFTAFKDNNSDLFRMLPKRFARLAARTLYKTVFAPIVYNHRVGYGKQNNIFCKEHGNLGNQPLTKEAIIMAKEAMAKQLPGVEPKYLLIPSVEKATMDAIRLLAQEAGLEIIEVLFWSDDCLEMIVPGGIYPSTQTINRWILVCDPRKVHTIEIDFLYGQQEPEIFYCTEEQHLPDLMFVDDHLTFKIRHIYGICVLSHRGMYMSMGM